MDTSEKKTAVRILISITTQKLAEKVPEIFDEYAVPTLYKMKVSGTASSEMMDILGLGSIEKTALISIVPRHIADEILVKLHKELKLGSVNSGIAFTLPVSGVNNFVLKILELTGAHNEHTQDRKDDRSMTESKHTLIAAIVNQGYSEEVMNAAKSQGAGGGTVFHSRHIDGEKASSILGFNIQEEKDIVLIVADNESKLPIMQAIGKECGIHSEAKGLVLSMPIDNVIGLND